VTGDNQATKLRIDDGMPLLQRLARHMLRRYRDLIEHDELVSIGYEGLCAAARTFDPSYGVPFQRYAWRRIHGFMMNRVHKRVQYAYAQRMQEAGSQAVTLLDDAGKATDTDASQQQTLTTYCDAVAAAMAISGMGMETAAMATSALQAEEALRLDRLRAMLRQALSTIDDELAQIVVAHYAEDKQLKQIAADAGVSYRTMRRRHNQALVALGRAIRAQHAGADETVLAATADCAGA